MNKVNVDELSYVVQAKEYIAKRIELLEEKAAEQRASLEITEKKLGDKRAKAIAQMSEGIKKHFYGVRLEKRAVRPEWWKTNRLELIPWSEYVHYATEPKSCWYVCLIMLSDDLLGDGLSIDHCTDVLSRQILPFYHDDIAIVANQFSSDVAPIAIRGLVYQYTLSTKELQFFVQAPSDWSLWEAADWLYGTGLYGPKGESHWLASSTDAPRANPFDNIRDEALMAIGATP